MTSAEAVLVSLQSHAEVLNTLDTSGKIFVASVSPQVRASLAATYSISEKEAGWTIDQLLGGPQGLASGGLHGNHFKWVVDTNAMREASLVLGAEEVANSFVPNTVNESSTPRKPIISSACPGWICYAEKTQPHVLPYLSHLKSPQALTGTLLKTVLSRRLNVDPGQIWHVAVMPCFDKKLEASREELTDVYWRPNPSAQPPVRDVDCVITARELLMLADTRGISFPSLPRRSLQTLEPFPDPNLHQFLFPTRNKKPHAQAKEAGTSGGYLHHILLSHLASHKNSTLTTTRGRNTDVTTYTITSPSSPTPLFRGARYYGFRNIQNLVRKLKPAKPSRMPGARPGAKAGGSVEYDYVEVMACPGGCTNGGGQIKVEDVPAALAGGTQKEWLARVDEAYYSMSDSDADSDGESPFEDNGEDIPMHTAGIPGGEEERGDEVNGISPSYVKALLGYWAENTGIELAKLVTTTFRRVESEVGKAAGGGGERGGERVVESIAGKIGGGW